MASSVSLTSHLNKLKAQLSHQLARHALLIKFIAASLTVGYITNLALGSYQGYLALGQGGLSHNVLGWLMQGLAQLIAKRDTRSIGPFRRPNNRETLGEAGGRTYLGSVVVPLRMEDGRERPTVPGYVAPQRQIDQFPGPEQKMRERMEGFLEALVAANPGVLVLKPSALEGAGTPALWLDNTSCSEFPPFMKRIKGETVHVHPECSSHVTLSMADAEEVVSKGWAERHRLSGVGKYLPWTYLLVYAPRNKEELRVWKGIIKAGVRFVCTAAGRELVAIDDV